MKNRSISKIFIICCVTLFTALSIMIVLSCSQQTNKHDKLYPNTIAENAKISDEYNDICQTISNTAIEEFKGLTKIPRESGNMDGIRNYIINWAKTNNINAILDPSGCIYIDVAATPGKDNFKNIIIQGHMDMVINTSEDYKNFDAKTSPIEWTLNEETGEMHSKDYKTNIGADDGMGLGLCMAIAKHQSDFEHGPIRLLFTYDEETTFEGAKAINADVLDANYLINFDFDWVGECVIGCSGSIVINFDKKYATTAPTEKGASENLTIKLDNLKGGHSGSDINKPRTNASSIIIRYLEELQNNTIHFRIASIDCGEANNMIADSFTLTLNINKKHEENAKNIFNNIADKIKEEFPEDNEFTYQIDVSEAGGSFPSKQDSDKILDVLKTIPSGVIEKKSEDDIITSCNLGVIKLENGILHCDALFRSSNNDVLKEEAKTISNDLKDKKIQIEIKDEDIDAAWSPEETSLSKMYTKSMKDVCNIPSYIINIHSGLEVSALKIKKPDMQCISIGGDVKDEHMLTETLYTKSFPVSILPIIYILEHANELN